MQRLYKIAGLTVAMDTYGQTEDQAIPYLTDSREPADLVIQSERDRVAAQHPGLPDQGCEYMGTGRSFYRQLVDFDGMMLHASAVALDGRSYLFTADPGTGKSTHTSNWRCVFGDDRVRLLNDDKPALRLIDGVWYACGTPWCGKTGQNLNLRFPIGGIAKVERAGQTRISRLPAAEAIPLLLAQTCIPDHAEGRLKLLALMDSLVTQVPFWRLECTPDPQSARISHAAMSNPDKNPLS